MLLGSALATGLAGCGGSDSEGTTATTETTAPTTTATTTTTTTTTIAEMERTANPQDTVAAGNAAVRIAHLSPDAPNADVAVDGTTVFTDVGFTKVTPYIVLYPGEHRLTVTRTGENETIFQEKRSLDGRGYTMAAMGEASGVNKPFTIPKFADTVEPSGGDTALLRLIHASPDAPGLDVSVKGDDGLLFDQVTFSNRSDYAELPSGDHTLVVRRTSDANDGKVYGEFDVSLQAGTVNSSFAIGYLSPSWPLPDEPFRVKFVTDSKRK